ncbi:MAG: hypothetical protein KJ621_16720 [Proteobacteria bacterium]|nr:hypothetical protein [Pseudomonadota bacterium]MBU1742732.1 hypothetical protein [Pseudomonadota bacterium]
MQGRLRKKPLSIEVNTECAHCGRSMDLEIDQDLNYRVEPEKCRPIVFVPDVNPFKLAEPSIIDSF